MLMLMCDIMLMWARRVLGKAGRMPQITQFYEIFHVCEEFTFYKVLCQMLWLPDLFDTILKVSLGNPSYYPPLLPSPQQRRSNSVTSQIGGLKWHRVTPSMSFLKSTPKSLTNLTLDTLQQLQPVGSLVDKIVKGCNIGGSTG